MYDSYSDKYCPLTQVLGPIIRQIHEACEKRASSELKSESSKPIACTVQPDPASRLDASAHAIIRQVVVAGDLFYIAYFWYVQRRSAVDMDGTTSTSKQSFFRMLAMTVPAITSLPWSW
jgi:hypothetical protein